MKIDINVKLYYNEETGSVYTEDEIKAEIAEDVENEIANLKSGNFHDYEEYITDFLREQDLSPLDLIDFIFDKVKAERFVAEYTTYLTECFTEGRFEELSVIEKKIQVEI